MNIIIAGGTGFIGQAVARHLIGQHHNITIITRDKNKADKIFGSSVKILTWEELNSINDADAIINFAGENLFTGLFTPKKKKQIIDSRVSTTKQLVNWINQRQQTITFISASGVSIYLPEKDHIYYENSFISKNPNNYMQQLALTWEDSANKADSKFCRVINLRQAVVLDKSGGMFRKILPIYKNFTGIILGDGKQPFPWIALADVVSAIAFLLKNEKIKGPVNIVAPEIISQEYFAKSLAKKFNKSAYLKIPGFLLKLVLLELAEEALLASPEVAPGVLKENLFEFKYPTLTSFLQDLT